ncbi:MAG: potassium transporter Kup [Candidatus Sulfobium sp.]|jgi:KUP system potassium uptake protein
MTKQHEEEEKRGARHLLILSLSALGVVYGDIGTSPLYAFRVCFSGNHSIDPTRSNILGVLSLIFWSLILVVSLKYLLVILRADNQGEGGILALMQLVLPDKGRSKIPVLIMGLFGAALLYGDGTITPAISVLSAMEGLEIATPVFKPYVVAFTLAILFLLFLLQHRGTGSVGLLFGPVMMLWFLVLAVSGGTSIVRNTAVLAALNPLHAVYFFRHQGFESLYILGAVFLVVTGGEALYADIGHFGRQPIRLAWFMVVLPSLLLNYFGQGALLLEDRSVAVNPFYHLTPSIALYPMVALATCATVIASQAIISGVFSLTFQALQLGYLPRMQILHTSEEERGQIFIPQVNWMLFAVTSAIVVGFGSSENMAAAYGLAVSTTMAITTFLGYFAMRRLWEWPVPGALLAVVFFSTIDASYLGANALKIMNGGWLPLLLAGVVYLFMSTWFTGREVVAKQMKEYVRPLKSYLENIDMRTVKKVPGTAIYLTDSPVLTPPAFVHNIQHNKILHRRIMFLYIGIKNKPHIRAEDRVKFGKLPGGAYRVLARYGFMDRPDVRAIIRIIHNNHIKINIENTTFFVGRDTLIPSQSVGMSKWRDRVYLAMRRNSERATKYFNIPPDRAIEIGGQIKF